MLLNAMRSGAQSKIMKTVLFGLLLMAVTGLAMTGGTSFFNNSLSQGGVATIGGEPLDAQAFDRTVRTVLARQGMDTDTAHRFGMIDRIMESEIGSRLLYRAARDKGILIGNDVITEQVGKIVAPHVSDKMNAKQVLASILMDQRMSEEQFVQTLRMEITGGTIRTAVQFGGNFTPDAEARDLYRYQHEARTVKAVVLPDVAIKDYQEPADAVLLPLYQAGQERYAVPEMRSFSLLVLTGADLREQPEAISDEDLKERYEQEAERFTTAEQRILERAVLDKKETADGVIEQVKKGTSLKDALKDAKSSGYIGEQTKAKADLEAEIAEPAFGAGKGDVVGPIPSSITPGSFLVLVVKDILPAQTKAFEEAKEEVGKEIMRERLAEKLYEEANRIDDLLAGGATLEEAAETAGLTIRKAGPLRPDGSTPDSTDGMKDYPQDRDSILKVVFELNEGEAAPVSELSDGSYAAIRVDAVQAKTYKPFDEVKGDIGKIWISDQQQTLNRRKAQEIMKTLGAGEKDLDAVAKENGLSVQTFKLERSEKPAEPLTEESAGQFFEKDKGDFAIAPAKDGLIVGEVTSIELPAADKIKEEDLKAMKSTAGQGTQQEYLIAYLDWLNEKYKVKINQPLLQTMYAPGGEQGQ